MKIRLIVWSCLLLLPLAAAEPRIVCDEESGICRLEMPQDESAAPENSPVESGMTGTPEALPAAVEMPPHDNFVPVRRHLGYTGKDEFMKFLRNSAGFKAGAGFWGMLLIALLGGLALNLTPCVLPMLPINLAVIGASGGASGFRRGLLYGLGMALVYGILGLLAAFAGVQFGILNSLPWFNFVIAAIFVILALAMAGVFNIDLASKYRINPSKLKFSKDMTALFMGGISALLAGACVAPVVISVLLFASGGSRYGFLIPFALGIGMALPWPFAGAGLAILPKPGRFMVVMKYIFAVVIFGAAIYYTGIGIKLLYAESDVSSVDADGFTALAEAKKQSLASGKPVLVKFTASWCKNCHAMDQTTLRELDVAEYIRKNFIMVTFPAEDPGKPEIAALLEEYEVPGFPAFVILEKR